MTIGLIVAACIVLLMLVLVLVPTLVHRAIMPGLEARIAKQYQQTEILMKDLTANNFGLESKGATQLRGNGGLVLTANELRFYQVVPEQEIVVPRADIVETSLVRWHLGKSVGYQLFKVSFSHAGQADSVAWYVANPAAWKAAIGK